jgi:hypothetical protein
MGRVHIIHFLYNVDPTLMVSQRDTPASINLHIPVDAVELEHWGFTQNSFCIPGEE